MKRLLIFCLLFVCCLGSAGADTWPARVLVTNDDGIDNPRLVALAKAFAEVAEVVVVAPLTNCSGSTNYISAFQRKELAVEPRNMGAGITAWAVDGFPGDCVLLALTGILADNPPDLIVSGINSGPNLSDAYLASGTIGAARLGAQHGVPSIAFSNLRTDDQTMMDAVPRWCVQLAQSPIAQNLGPGEYLTVNFPKGPASKVKGVCWAPLGGQVFHDAFEAVGRDALGRQLWRNRFWFDDGDNQPQGSDVAQQRAGWITVTPMRLGDQDTPRLEKAADLPVWNSP